MPLTDKELMPAQLRGAGPHIDWQGAGASGNIQHHAAFFITQKTEQNTELSFTLIRSNSKCKVIPNTHTIEKGMADDVLLSSCIRPGPSRSQGILSVKSDGLSLNTTTHVFQLNVVFSNTSKPLRFQDLAVCRLRPWCGIAQAVSVSGLRP
jgi:hypothetical protein